jgi:hypothetical protein
MSQIEEKTKKSSAFTCPNTSCAKVFTKPLKALNLQQDSEGPYDACPYCLTEIPPDNGLMVTCDEPKETEAEEKEYTEEQDEIPEKSSECGYHLGYLSERSSKEKIPDECIMCKDIVECMLKKMKK